MYVTVFANYISLFYAPRVAQEAGVPIGGLVGYQVRLEASRGPETRLLMW